MRFKMSRLCELAGVQHSTRSGRLLRENKEEEELEEPIEEYSLYESDEEEPEGALGEGARGGRGAHQGDAQQAPPRADGVPPLRRLRERQGVAPADPGPLPARREERPRARTPLAAPRRLQCILCSLCGGRV